ncbi:hypothetical protein COOONC_09446 [Cooperia oncophora]
MILRQWLLLLLSSSLVSSIELNIENETEFWSDILSYADSVGGTVLNIVLLGGSLIALSSLGFMHGFRIDPLDCLIFASLIAAVDPVAVLAIFQEVGVNKMLYFMVFGESLLNDAVTIVCYNLVIEFKELDSIGFMDVSHA